MDNWTVNGNDIIDLSLHPKTLWMQKRFLLKILVDSEFEYFNSHPEIDFFPELLFTCKESAYKYFVKHGRIMAFNPRSFTVTLINKLSSTNAGEINYSGKINCNFGECLFSSQVISNCFIHTVSFSEKYTTVPLLFILKDEQADIKDKSERANQAMINFLVEKFLFDPADVEIIKDQPTQIPLLYIKGKKAPYDISISHDGSYLAGSVIKTIF
jgi:phosphopantetheinyl transferase (holo-ACP synthase)